MCCSFDTGKPSTVQFGQYFVFEDGTFRNIQKFPENTTEEQGYYVGYPVCKFSGKILRQNQKFTTGGSPEMTGFEANFDILLVDEKTSERYQLQNVQKQYTFRDIHNTPDDLVPHVGQEVYGILTQKFHFEDIELLQFYKNKEVFDTQTQEIPICKIQNTPFVSQQSKNEMATISENLAPITQTTDNTSLGMGIGIGIFFLILISYFLYKKFYRL